MAGTNPVFYDQAKLKVGTVWITIGTEIDRQKTFKNTTAAATWGSNEVDKPTSKKETIVVPYMDMEGHVDLDALEDMEDGELHAIEVYPEGDAAGSRMYTGNAYVTTSGAKGGKDSAASGTLTLFVSGGLTASPNLALSVLDFGSTGQGDASAFTAPTASGGTSTYTITMADEDAVASALPYGVTWTGSVFTGTVNAAAPLGKYRVKVKVVDSGSPAVTKYFDCTMKVVA